MHVTEVTLDMREKGLSRLLLPPFARWRLVQCGCFGRKCYCPAEISICYPIIPGEHTSRMENEICFVFTLTFHKAANVKCDVDFISWFLMNSFLALMWISAKEGQR